MSKIVWIVSVMLLIGVVWTAAGKSKPTALSREDGLELELVTEKLAHAQLNLAVAQAQANDAQAANNALVTKLAKKYGIVVGHDVVDVKNGYVIAWGAGKAQPAPPSVPTPPVLLPDAGAR